MKYVLGDSDTIIDKSDALKQWGTGHFVSGINHDYWSIFKPENYDDVPFLTTKRFLLVEAPAQKKYPENLTAIADVLNWELGKDELEAARDDIIYLVDLLNLLPWRSRQVLCALVQKANQIRYDEMVAGLSDLSKTMNLTALELESELAVLKKYELIDVMDDRESKQIYLRSPSENWLIWGQLKGYCQRAGISLRRLLVDLQFDLLDSA